MQLELDPSQDRAVDLMCSARIGIVTGGPGTGKSTCLRTALDRLDRSGQRYELAAPTGKAAKRVNETTGRAARTIHRLLGWTPRGWTYHDGNPLRTDAVLVDESSMIDVELGAALLSAIDPARTRLILIGDADQLPPVGPGRVFGDLVDARSVPIARLTTLHRAAAESWVAVNAPKVLRGEALDLQRRRDFRYYPVTSAADILPRIRSLYTDPAEADLIADMQVLIPQKDGAAGIEAGNRVLQSVLTPRQPGDPYLMRGERELRMHDRVIQTRNDYKIEVFNGEVGEIVGLDQARATVRMDGRAVEYTLEQAGHLQHAYALTVHRAQGSEFPWVLAVCHSTHSFMLSRQLLYTAITRAKRGVILVGDDRGIERALSDARPPKRNTALIERMQEQHRSE